MGAFSPVRRALVASISFSLNNRQWAALENHRQESESLNLAAKRLFLSVLESPEPTDIETVRAELAEFASRLKAVEKKVQARCTP